MSCFPQVKRVSSYKEQCLYLYLFVLCLHNSGVEVREPLNPVKNSYNLPVNSMFLCNIMPIKD